MFFRKRGKKPDPKSTVSEPVTSFIKALETRPNTIVRAVRNGGTDEMDLVYTDTCTSLEVRLFGPYIGINGPDSFCLTKAEKYALDKALWQRTVLEQEKEDSRKREKWIKLYSALEV